MSHAGESSGRGDRIHPSGPLVARELVRARGRCGRSEAQWANLAQIQIDRGKFDREGPILFAQDQEAVARVLGSQNSDWPQLARDRRDISKVGHLIPGPYRPRVIRVFTGQSEYSDASIGDPGKGEKRGGEAQKRHYTGDGSWGRQKERTPAAAQSPGKRGYNAFP